MIQQRLTETGGVTPPRRSTLRHASPLPAAPHHVPSCAPQGCHKDHLGDAFQPTNSYGPITIDSAVFVIPLKLAAQDGSRTIYPDNVLNRTSSDTQTHVER